MKIGIIVPNIQMTERQLKERKDFLMRKIQTKTEIEMIKLEQGPLCIESSLEHEQAGYFIAKKISELNKEKYQAFIIWCGEDAGLTSAREVSKVPVIGPFQSSCSIAILLGHKFSIIGPMVQKAFIERKVWELGLGFRLASIRSIGIPVLQVRKNLNKTFILLERECERAIRNDGADVIVLSCMALFGMANSLIEKFGIPIIDPALAALKMAETFTSLRLTHSRITYNLPIK
jgi:allantoin racemase